MNSIEKITAIAHALAIHGGNMTDAQLCTIAGVTVADLDSYYKQAELAVFKAKTKPAQPLAGEALLMEVDGWITYLFGEGVVAWQQEARL